MNNDLFDYTLQLADNALILAQRNSEWTGHGPVLEQDIAMSNISLDLIGQARMFYQYAALQKGNGANEDSLAYGRDAWDFKNVLIVELEKGDWAKSVLRQFLFSVYQHCLYEKLENCADPTISGIAVKAIKEVTYHLKWSAEWVIRLGDGTTESHLRIANALKDLWAYTGELLIDVDYEIALANQGIVFPAGSYKGNWMKKVKEVLEEATLLPVLEGNLEKAWMQKGGKIGKHTEHLGYILAEMQYLQRTYPGCDW